MITPRNFGNLPLDVRKHFNFVLGNMSKISGVSIVIPIRGMARYTNLMYVINRFLSQNVEPLEIIVSEEDTISQIKLDKYQKDSRIKKVFTVGKKDKFNKSIAINAGVCLAKYNKILMNDADIVPPTGYLSRLDKILETYESFFVGKTIYNVHLYKNILNWRGSKRDDYFSGGSIGFTKSAFANIGGMCEKFEGYGSEDCEFFDRIKKCTNLYEERDSCLLHLHHDRKSSFSENVVVYDQIVNKDMQTRIQELQNDLNLRKVSLCGK